MDVDSLRNIVNKSKQWSESNEAILEKPYSHIAFQQGKKFRSKLMEAFNEFYNIPIDKLLILTTIIDILHNSSLMVDDIEDNSSMRRGVKASHVIYGVPITLNSANYMYFKAMGMITRLAPKSDSNGNDFEEIQTLKLEKSLMKVFEEELCNLHRGQGLDIYWRDNGIIPTQQMYFEMVLNKTGGLFRLSVRLMETLSLWYKEQAQKKDNNFFIIDKSLVPLCNILGIIYQIRDDYLNLVDDTMARNKGFGEDITEGKLSFPIIHALDYEKNQFGQDGTSHLFIWNTLSSRTEDIEIKKKFIEYLKTESMSLDYTKITLQNLLKLVNDGDYIPCIEESDSSSKTCDAINQLLQIISYLSSV